MIDPAHTQQIENAQRELDATCPAPEEDIVRLALSVAFTPENERYSEVRFLVLEIDNLVSQLRWDLDQALLVLEMYPQIAEDREYQDLGEIFSSEASPKDASTLSQLVSSLPTKSHLLLRSLEKRTSPRVLSADLSERRGPRGGTRAGWIYHMMIDNAVIRAISLLDRQALLLSLVADVHFPNHKVYFRSRKLAAIHNKLGMPESQRLVECANDPLYEYLLEYRDGWSHNRMAFARFAGILAADIYTNASGQRVLIRGDEWTADALFSLAQAAYNLVVTALHETASVCEQIAPKDDLGVWFQEAREEMNEDL